MDDALLKIAVPLVLAALAGLSLLGSLIFNVSGTWERIPEEGADPTARPERLTLGAHLEEHLKALAVEDATLDPPGYPFARIAHHLRAADLALAREGIVPFGAGMSLPAARQGAVVERRGMRIGLLGYLFLGEHSIEPPALFAGPGRPGVAASIRVSGGGKLLWSRARLKQEPVHAGETREPRPAIPRQHQPGCPRSQGEEGEEAFHQAGAHAQHGDLRAH